MEPKLKTQPMFKDEKRMSPEMHPTTTPCGMKTFRRHAVKEHMGVVEAL